MTNLLYYKNPQLLQLNLNFLLLYIQKRLISQGKLHYKQKLFLNFFLKFKYEVIIDFYYLFYRAFLNILPILKLKTIKKRKKEIYKIKGLSYTQRVKVALMWFVKNLTNKEQLVFVEFLLFDLVKLYFKSSNLNQKKFDEYAECMRSKFFK